MERRFSTFVGIDLGGARGKTTAVARLQPTQNGVAGVMVAEVNTRHNGTEPWHDAAVLDYVVALEAPTVIAINAPLTVPACLRCQLPACPGKEACVDPAVQWLYSEGVALIHAAHENDWDRIVAVPTNRAHSRRIVSLSPSPKPRLEPYIHRATEIELHYARKLLPRDVLGLGTGPIAARGVHLRRLLASRGFTLNRDLLEVSPRATVQALFGSAKARGYKRDADPWHTRANIVEQLKDLQFAPSSRLSREEVLRNDHCFESLLSAYSAYLWARDGWTMPDGVFPEDGWIWAPP